MSGAIRLALAVVLIANTLVIVHTQRLKDRMYVSLNGASCFRRLNGTHETGCSSKFGGSIGVLHVVRTAADFAFIHNAPPAPPYTVVVPTSLFTREHIMPLQRAPNTVAGILLIRAAAGDTPEPAPANYSHELQCPNQYSTYNEATCDSRRNDTLWNPFGTGLLHVSFPFPIYYLSNPAEVRTVVDCYDRFNAPDPAGQHQRSLCSVQINQFMAATDNSEVCIRRNSYNPYIKPTRFCDALSGNNLFATLFPRDPIPPPTPPATVEANGTADLLNDSATVPPTIAAAEQFIIVCARMDSTSMFDGIAPGAMEVLPLVTVLSTAHTLATLLPSRLAANQPNVLFALFNGEAYDYIGSQRFVYDMRRGEFPPRRQRRPVIRPEQIQLVIDVAGLDDPSTVYAYQVRDFPLGTQLLSALEKYNRAHSLGVTVTARLQPDQPPSAVQSFLRDNATAWPTVALASPASNRYLHSMYDDAHNVRFTYANTSKDFERLEDVSLPVPAAGAPFANDSLQMAVRNVSTVLAFTLYELVTGRPYSGRLGASAVLADELLHCYVEASNCPLMFAALGPNISDSGVAVPPQRYISVEGVYLQETTSLTYPLLGLLVGRRENRTEEECKMLPWHWMAGWNGTGECRLGTHNFSLAYSPAWTVKNYDLSSGRYSTWTESSWTELSARIFLQPSSTHESLTLAIGFVVMTFSFVIVFLVNSRADVLFGGDSRRSSSSSSAVASSMLAVGAAANAPAQC